MSEELPQDVVDEAAGAADAKPAHPSWLPFVIDFGPLLAFFLTFKLTKGAGAFGATTGALKATGVFMVAILIALFVSQWKLKKITPMLWISALMVLVFGGVTLYFHDERFIVMKPTIVYGILAAVLIGGWATGHPLIKYIMQSAYDGLTERGWLLLSRNWGFFFVLLAGINHALYILIQRQELSFDTWLSIKVWGTSAASLLFALSQLPVMIRNGLDLGGSKTEE